MKGLLRININLKVLILGREENRSTRRKTLEAQEKSTTSTLSHETSELYKYWNDNSR